jgi:hypothetical protein
MVQEAPVAAAPKKSKAGKKASPGPEEIPPEFLARLQEFYDMAASLSPNEVEALTVPELIDAILGDGSAEEPDRIEDDLEDLEDFLSELEEALTELRIAASGGDRDARRESEDLRRWFAKRLDTGDYGNGSLFALAQVFHRSQFDPGPAFQRAFARQFAADGTTLVDESNFHELLQGIVGDADGNPYLLFESVFQITRFLDENLRRAIIEVLSGSDNEVVREAIVGFLLGAEGEARIVLNGLVASAAAKPASGHLVAKLVRLRGLLPSDRHPPLDDAIKTLRLKAASIDSQPAYKPESLFSSIGDGIGAQALVVHMTQGRKHHLVSVMVKIGQGIADVVILPDVPPSEIKRTLARMRDQLSAIPITLGLFQRRLEAALADNHTSGNPVPFALLEAMEKTGVAALRSEPMKAEALFDEMIATSLFDAADPQTFQMAMQAITDFNRDSGLDHGWFEAGQEVDTLLGKVKTRKRRVEALLHELLLGRRQFWIEQCAWAAATLRDKSFAKKRPWLWYALLGKQLCGNGPVSESPLMRAIAELSVEAYAASR